VPTACVANIDSLFRSHECRSDAPKQRRRQITPRKVRHDDDDVLAGKLRAPAERDVGRGACTLTRLKPHQLLLHVLAELAGRVYSVEIIDELAQRAIQRQGLITAAAARTDAPAPVNSDRGHWVQRLFNR
jgi:hypothetical protein